MKKGARKSLLALSLLDTEEQKEVIRWLTEDEKRLLANEADTFSDERIRAVLSNLQEERYG